MVDKEVAELVHKPNWSVLDTDLLKLVLKKLVFFDIFRFKSVCSSWNKAAKSFISSPSFYPSLQTPLLMLPPNQQRHDAYSRLILNPGEKKVYKLEKLFKGIDGARCVGSSHGILLVLDKKGNLFVVNPLYGQRFKLPSIRPSDLFICKAVVLLPDPSRTSNSSFVVVILYSGSSKLAYCNGEERKWTKFQVNEAKYWDILFHNGHLYALTRRDFVEVWDFENFPSPTRIINFDFVPVDMEYNILTKYLVESMGELLIVKKFGSATTSSARNKLKFGVSKVDLSGKKCEKMENLDGRALFVGKNQSMSVSTSDFPGCQENSIYFIEDYIIFYNLKTEVVKYLYVHDNCVTDQSSFWIIPNPREITKV